jgi:hypothetical protein
MMEELDKKRKTVEQEGCFDEDGEPGKQIDEDTLTTVTYDSEGEADEDDDPSKFVPSPGPRVRHHSTFNFTTVRFVIYFTSFFAYCFYLFIFNTM